MTDHIELKRYRYHYDCLGDCCCDMDEHVEGEYVAFFDHKKTITELQEQLKTWENQDLLEQCNRQAEHIESLQARIAELESAIHGYCLSEGMDFDSLSQAVEWFFDEFQYAEGGGA